MNVRFLNIIGLLSCWLFLIGNITFDILEHLQAGFYAKQAAMMDKAIGLLNEQPIATKDYSNWYFIPQAIMIMCLLIMCNDFTKKEVKKIRVQWYFFTLLSVSNVVKNIVLNPINFAVNEYIVLAICITITFLKHRKNEKLA